MEETTMTIILILNTFNRNKFFWSPPEVSQVEPKEALCLTYFLRTHTYILYTCIHRYIYKVSKIEPIFMSTKSLFTPPYNRNQLSISPASFFQFLFFFN